MIASKRSVNTMRLSESRVGAKSFRRDRFGTSTLPNQLVLLPHQQCKWTSISSGIGFGIFPHRANLFCMDPAPVAVEKFDQSRERVGVGGVAPLLGKTECPLSVYVACMRRRTK